MRNRDENLIFQIRESRTLLVSEGGKKGDFFWFIIFPASCRARMYIYLIPGGAFQRFLLSGDFLQ